MTREELAKQAKALGLGVHVDPYNKYGVPVDTVQIPKGFRRVSDNPETYYCCPELGDYIVSWKDLKAVVATFDYAATRCIIIERLPTERRLITTFRILPDKDPSLIPPLKSPDGIGTISESVAGLWKTAFDSVEVEVEVEVNQDTPQ